MTNSFTLPSTESIVSEVFKAYNSLPKNGKPRLRDSGAFEWTILAGFCLCTPLSPEDWKVACVSLGTGLRVLPYEKLPVHGDVLHDCHAEIIARRGLLVYLYDQLSLIAQGLDEECHLEASADGKWKLKEGIKLVMYVSTLPCGDASTYLLSLQAPPSPIISPSDSSPQSISSDSTSKNLDSTSAKTPYFTTVLANSLGLNTSRSSAPPPNSSSPDTTTTSTVQQVRRGRVGYTSLSSLRTKPGRIDSPPSISHSCSDKLAMWSVLGVQGALLSTLIDSIMIGMVVIGAVEDDQERKRIQEEVERALGGRLDGLVGRKVNVPEVRFTEEAFQDGRERAKELAGEGGEVVSCLTTISYIRSHTPERQIIEKGVKQGSPMKRSNGEAIEGRYRSVLSKLSLFNRYIEVSRLFGVEVDEESTYYEIKQSSHTYQNSKSIIRGVGAPFEGWLVSGEKFEDFMPSGRLKEN